jgi:hypothetical protein
MSVGFLDAIAEYDPANKGGGFFFFFFFFFSFFYNLSITGKAVGLLDFVVICANVF